MRRIATVCFLAFVSLSAMGCARLANEGEICSSPGVSESEYANAGLGGDCAEGLICAPERSAPGPYTEFERARCRTTCVTSPDCSENPGYTCRGVTGAETHLACLPPAPTAAD